mgnify:CR=1 FL=1
MNAKRKVWCIGNDSGFRFAISFKPGRFRDIYWCFRLNEPMIISYKDNEKHCVNCGVFDKDMHVFLGHIIKDGTQ